MVKGKPTFHLVINEKQVWQIKLINVSRAAMGLSAIVITKTDATDPPPLGDKRLKLIFSC